MLMDVAIMLEGQNGLNWSNFKRIAQAVEDLGFAGLYRSDHFTNPGPPDVDSLELWVSLAWLASNTSRIDFGSLVTPVSFRDPVFTARMGKDIDDLSGGRLHLGIGAGWQEREHEMFGYDLLDLAERMDRFEEGLEVISLLLGSDGPVNFEGDYYELHQAILLPPPARPGGPRILIGGNGEQKTLRLVSRYADMWNGVYITAQRFGELNRVLDGYLEEEQRPAGDVHRSLMTGLVFGRDDADLKRKLEERGRTAEELRSRGMVVGTAEEVVDQLGEIAEAGAQRVMLQWLALDDIDGLEALASGVLEQTGQGNNGGIAKERD
ncbi:MAG: TIGR03560 family F420-dependent LLM class oxidoreductase [Anaerolineae bacterium]|nr:TIGR03560 family F420-dependent LLM class oxidoreductase [Anaerolineae bacterium]